MKFRTLFVMYRVIAPVAFVGIALSMLVDSRPVMVVVRTVSIASFLTVCIYGAFKGLQMQFRGFLMMRCPFCETESLVGYSQPPGIGWWLTCEECGVITPKGLLGLKFRRQTEAEFTGKVSEDLDERDS